MIAPPRDLKEWIEKQIFHASPNFIAAIDPDLNIAYYVDLLNAIKNGLGKMLTANIHAIDISPLTPCVKCVHGSSLNGRGLRGNVVGLSPCHCFFYFALVPLIHWLFINPWLGCPLMFGSIIFYS